MDNQWMTTQDVAAYLHLGRTSTYRLFRLPDFPAVKIGKDYRVHQADLDEYLREYRGHQIFLQE